MSVAAAATAPPALSFFERYLTVWVALCIVIGVAIGQWLPGPTQAVGRMEIARVNLPVGALIWVMIIPMLVSLWHGYLARGLGNLRTLFTHWWLVGVTPLPELTLDKGTGLRLPYELPIMAGLVVALWRR